MSAVWLGSIKSSERRWLRGDTVHLCLPLHIHTESAIKHWFSTGLLLCCEVSQRPYSIQVWDRITNQGSLARSQKYMNLSCVRWEFRKCEIWRLAKVCLGIGLDAIHNVEGGTNNRKTSWKRTWGNLITRAAIGHLSQQSGGRHSKKKKHETANRARLMLNHLLKLLVYPFKNSKNSSDKTISL